MPYNKAQTLLLLFLDLQKGPKLRSEVLKKYSLTERTLRRYIVDLKQLGYNIRSEPTEIVRGRPVLFPEAYIILE